VAVQATANHELAKFKYYDSAELVLLVGLVALVIFVSGVGAWCNERRSRLDPRLVCPHCDKALQIDSAWVIANGNCRRCCGRVLGTDPGHKNKQWSDPEL
jgi:hypothetical protein